MTFILVFVGGSGYKWKLKLISGFLTLAVVDAATGDAVRSLRLGHVRRVVDLGNAHFTASLAQLKREKRYRGQNKIKTDHDTRCRGMGENVATNWFLWVGDKRHASTWVRSHLICNVHDDIVLLAQFLQAVRLGLANSSILIF